MSIYIYQIILFIGINLILAMSLHVVLGECGLFSVASSAFMAIGAYAATVLHLNFDLHFLPAIVTGGLFAAVCGLVVSLPVVRLKSDYLLMGTFGFAEVTRVVLLNTEYTNGALGIAGIPLYSNIPLIYGIFLVVLVMTVILSASKIGRAWRAIREDETAAVAMGVNAYFYKNLAFSISAFYAGLAGGLYAFLIGFISPNDFSMMLAFTIYLFLVLGGLGQILGAIIGTVLLSILPEVLRTLQDWRMVFYGLALILMVIFRPEGLLGRVDTARLFFWTKGRQAPAKTT